MRVRIARLDCSARTASASAQSPAGVQALLEVGVATAGVHERQQLLERACGRKKVFRRLTPPCRLTPPRAPSRPLASRRCWIAFRSARLGVSCRIGRRRFVSCRLGRLQVGRGPPTTSASCRGRFACGLSRSASCRGRFACGMSRSASSRGMFRSRHPLDGGRGRSPVHGTPIHHPRASLLAFARIAESRSSRMRGSSVSGFIAVNCTIIVCCAPCQ